jgi:hypothetical protein
MARTKRDIQSEADKYDDPISWFRELEAADGKAAPRTPRRRSGGSMIGRMGCGT